MTIFSSIFTWKNIIRGVLVSIFAILIRKGIYFLFDIDILIEFLINNTLISYSITFLYFLTNFYAGLSIGEIFNSLGLKYIKENKYYLGLPLGLELPKDKLLLDDRGEISKSNIKEIIPKDSLNQDNIQPGGSSTLNNIDELLKSQRQFILDLEKLVADSKGSLPEVNLDNKLHNYNNLIKKTIELRTEFLKDDLSLKVSRKNSVKFSQEFKGLSKAHRDYIDEINSISTYDPNAKKKAFDALNKYKNTQNKTLNLLTELTRRDLKDFKAFKNKEEGEFMLKNLNRFENAANSSQSEVKKLQKELGENIDKLNK